MSALAIIRASSSASWGGIVGGELSDSVSAFSVSDMLSSLGLIGPANAGYFVVFTSAPKLGRGARAGPGGGPAPGRDGLAARANRVERHAHAVRAPKRQGR